MARAFWTGVLPVALSGPGCIFVPAGDSCDVPTGDISMNATVVDDGQIVRAVADFQDGPRGQPGGIRLNLCKDDTLTINGTEATEVFKSSRIEYSATWNLAEAPTEYVFELTRSDAEIITARVTLPPSFEIQAPLEAEQISRGTDATFSWDPTRPEESIHMELSDKIAEPCQFDPAAPNFPAGVQVTDSGEFVVLAGTVVLDPTAPPGEFNCDMYLELSREEAGEYPAAFDPSGSLSSRVARRVDFVSVP